jgi:acetyl-CoA carboxylase carboxyl transferase subunit beta
MAWDGFSLKRRKEVPEGLWMRCPACEAMIYKKVVEERLLTCPECNRHFRVPARKRVQFLTDPVSFEEYLADLEPADPLSFTDRKSYVERVRSEQRKTGLRDACLCGKAFIKGRPVVLAVLDPDFIMGSMGSVVGEKVTYAAEEAGRRELPLVVVSCSGGARMQEGILSLMQMAKTSAALARLQEAGGLYISVLTDPTTAGVAASFAFLGDVNIAEPGAMIGFAGPRVIAGTIGGDLPAGFQSAEFCLEHGFIDMIVDRRDLRSEIARLIDYLRRPTREAKAPAATA